MEIIQYLCISHITINNLPTVNCKLGKGEISKTTVVFKFSLISSNNLKCSWSLQLFKQLFVFLLSEVLEYLFLLHVKFERHNCHHHFNPSPYKMCIKR